ncbi:MAG: hypothetical protein RLZZ306_768 [Bacteroidota bacterium]|jgi:hypothetical protein
MIFDEQGYLTPYDVQEITLKGFGETFATNESRQSLLVEYYAFIEHLNSLGINNFYQWIDGSFVTKKIAPKDIDVVSFIETKDFKKNEKELLLLSKMFENIDCYFVEVFLKDDKKYFITQTDTSYWFHLFQGTRKPRVKKGFVQVNFGNHGN